MAKFTNKDLRLKDGQKVTWGSDLDSDIWWDDAEQELRLNTVISGVQPTKPDHLTPKFYVDDLLGGDSWQEPITNIDSGDPPAGPSDSDRYIVEAGTGDWTGHDDEIAEWDATAGEWKYHTPNEGDTTWNDVTNQYMVYEDGSWKSYDEKYVTLDGDQIITGNKTFDNSVVTTFLGDVFFNGITITMSGTTFNTESGAIFNYDDTTTINNAADNNFLGGSTTNYEDGSTVTHESGSVDIYEDGSTVTYSGADVNFEGDTNVTFGDNTTTEIGGDVTFTTEPTFSGGINIPPGIPVNICHSDLDCLDQDDHTQYPLVDGTRGFTSTVSGSTPVNGYDLATKEYIDGELATLSGGIVQSHSSLTNLDADDHTQYILVDGTRAFTGTVGGVTPTAANHLTTKDYVDLLFQGLDWQDSINDYWDPTGGLPGSAVEGDRYLATASGNGWGINNIYDYNGSSWDEIIPNEGFTTWVENEDALYVYNGSDWVRFGSTVTHNNTNGLQGGTSNEYFHMRQQEYYDIAFSGNSSIDDASNQHHHDGRYYTETEMDATISGLQNQISNNLSNTVTLDGDQTITGNKTFDNSGTTTFLGNVFFNGIEITMSGTTVNTESGAIFNYDDSTTINYDGTSNYTSTAVTNNAGDTNYQNGSTVTHEDGSTEVYESGSEVNHKSGSNETYEDGSSVTYSGAVIVNTGDTTITNGADTVTNNDGTTNFNSGSETVFHPGSSVTFSGTTNFNGAITGMSHGDLEDLGNDDHTQYTLADGSRGFTGTVSGVAPVLGSDLATKDYVDSSDKPQLHGRAAIADQASSVTVSFADVGSTNYTVNATMENTSDSPPSIYAFIISAKTSSSFTATFMGDMDSANYILNWSIIED